MDRSDAALRGRPPLPYAALSLLCECLLVAVTEPEVLAPQAPTNGLVDVVVGYSA